MVKKRSRKLKNRQRNTDFGVSVDSLKNLAGGSIVGVDDLFSAEVNIYDNATCKPLGPMRMRDVFEKFG